MNRLRQFTALSAAALAAAGLSACAEEAEAPEYEDGTMTTDEGMMMPGDQTGAAGAPVTGEMPMDDGTATTGTMDDPETMDMTQDPSMTTSPDDTTTNPPG